MGDPGGNIVTSGDGRRSAAGSVQLLRLSHRLDAAIAAP